MTLNDVAIPIAILTYSAEEGTVNGQTVTRGRYPTIHEACIALTVQYAQQAGAPILAHAVDTIGTPAEYWLHVHPDGQATPAAAGSHPSPVPGPPDRAPSGVQLPAAGTDPAGSAPPGFAPALAPLPVLAPLTTMAPFPAMPPLPASDPPGVEVEASPEDGVPDDPRGLAVTTTFERIPAQDGALLTQFPGPDSVVVATVVAAGVADVAGEVTADEVTADVAADVAADEAGRAEADAGTMTADAAPELGAELPSTRAARRHTADPDEPRAGGTPAPILTPVTVTPRPVTVTPLPLLTHTPTPSFRVPASPSAPTRQAQAGPAWVSFVEPGGKSPSPTLDDLLATRPAPPDGAAQLGWRAGLRRLSGGLITLRPNEFEMTQRTAIAAVQRSLTGPKTVVVINPKGGASKTTATLLLAATFGIHRGGYTLAWDNNETRGTMGWRAVQGRHTNTAVDLLRELDRFEDARWARVGDLDNFVRNQGSAQFDVLASDEDAASAASVDATAFNALHRSLSRFYRVIVVDTGNNMRASNWDAAVAVADQVVIVATIREDTGQSAAWVADALNEKGYAEKVSAAVTILAAPSTRPDPALATRLGDHFGRLTRGVVRVPFDPSLVSGGPIDIEALSSSSRDAWLAATALVADGL